MLTTNTRFEHIQRGLIESIIRDNSDNLGNGSCATLEEYKFQVGIIRGLNMALELTEEVNKKLDER